MEAIRNETVALFGDSLGKGVFWNERRHRYAYCGLNAADVAAQKLGVTVVNRAKFGLTAPQGLDVLDGALSAGLRCDAAVIEFGGNDCNFHWEEISAAPQARHEPATAPDTFEHTLRCMIRRLTESGVRPILATLPPINAERYFRFLVGDRLNAANILRWLGDVQQIYRFQEMYSHIVERAAREMKTQLLDLRVRCLAQPRFTADMLCMDGLHMNEEGQAFVGGQIADMVEHGET